MDAFAPPLPPEQQTETDSRPPPPPDSMSQCMKKHWDMNDGEESESESQLSVKRRRVEYNQSENSDIDCKELLNTRTLNELNNTSEDSAMEALKSEADNLDTGTCDEDSKIEFEDLSSEEDGAILGLEDGELEDGEVEEETVKNKENAAQMAEERRSKTPTPPPCSNTHITCHKSPPPLEDALPEVRRILEEEAAAAAQKDEDQNNLEDFQPGSFQQDFVIIDDVEGSDNEGDSKKNSNRNEDIGADVYDSDYIDEDEIDALLDKELGDKKKDDNDIKKREFTVREKTILVERGKSPFDILPEGWVQVCHHSGIPVFLHKPTRVCTLAKPYFLGAGSVRRHNVPLSAIPCLQYRRALLDEKAKALGAGNQNVESGDAATDNQNSEVQKKLNGNDSDAPQAPPVPADTLSKLREDLQALSSLAKGSQPSSPQPPTTSPPPEPDTKPPPPPPSDAAGAPGSEQTEDQSSQATAVNGDATQPAGKCPFSGSKPQVKSIEEHKANETLEGEQVQEYCRKLFEFRTVSVKRFHSWNARHKAHKEEVAKRNAHLLPSGTNVLTCEAPTRYGGLYGGRKKRELVLHLKGKNDVCILHEYAQHVLRAQPVYEYKETTNAEKPFLATISINGIVHGSGSAASKKQAKAAAALAALQALVPNINKLRATETTHKCEYEYAFFDEIVIEDPRIVDLSQKTGHPLPFSVLQECLKRNFGMGDTNMVMDMHVIKPQRSQFTMKVAQYEAKVMCKNKREGRHLAAQQVLQKMHPHIKSWGSILRIYARDIEAQKLKLDEIDITSSDDQDELTSTYKQSDAQNIDYVGCELTETNGASNVCYVPPMRNLDRNPQGDKGLQKNNALDIMGFDTTKLESSGVYSGEWVFDKPTFIVGGDESKESTEIEVGTDTPVTVQSGNDQDDSQHENINEVTSAKAKTMMIQQKSAEVMPINVAVMKEYDEGSSDMYASIGITENTDWVELNAEDDGEKEEEEDVWQLSGTNVCQKQEQNFRPRCLDVKVRTGSDSSVENVSSLETRNDQSIVSKDGSSHGMSTDEHTRVKSELLARISRMRSELANQVFPGSEKSWAENEITGESQKHGSESRRDVERKDAGTQTVWVGLSMFHKATQFPVREYDTGYLTAFAAHQYGLTSGFGHGSGLCDLGVGFGLGYNLLVDNSAYAHPMKSDVTQRYASNPVLKGRLARRYQEEPKRYVDSACQTDLTTLDLVDKEIQCLPADLAATPVAISRPPCTVGVSHAVYCLGNQAAYIPSAPGLANLNQEIPMLKVSAADTSPLVRVAPDSGVSSGVEMSAEDCELQNDSIHSKRTEEAALGLLSLQNTKLNAATENEEKNNSVENEDFSSKVTPSTTALVSASTQVATTAATTAKPNGQPARVEQGATAVSSAGVSMGSASVAMANSYTTGLAGMSVIRGYQPTATVNPFGCNTAYGGITPYGYYPDPFGAFGFGTYPSMMIPSYQPTSLVVSQPQEIKNKRADLPVSDSARKEDNESVNEDDRENSALKETAQEPAFIGPQLPSSSSNVEVPTSRNSSVPQSESGNECLDLSKSGRKASLVSGIQTCVQASGSLPVSMSATSQPAMLMAGAGGVTPYAASVQVPTMLPQAYNYYPTAGMEKESVTKLQTKSQLRPNLVILNKLKEQMLKLHDVRKEVESSVRGHLEMPSLLLRSKFHLDNLHLEQPVKAEDEGQ